MPDEIVRFNSIVTIQIPNGDEKTFQIVTPEKSDISLNKLSILAPMGLALFGYAVGDEFLWQFPTGMNKIKIQKVNQVDETQKTFLKQKCDHRITAHHRQSRITRNIGVMG